MQVSDWLMLAAVLLGPIFSVQIARWLEDRKERRARKLLVFRTLMATRARKLSTEHVEALNMIDVEFYGPSNRERAVTRAWNEYLDLLNNGSIPREHWMVKVDESFIEVLHKMAQCLGYDFDKVQLKNQSYSPMAHGNIEKEQHELRQRLIELLRGTSALPVHPVMTAGTVRELPDGRAAVPEDAQAVPTQPPTELKRGA